MACRERAGRRRPGPMGAGSRGEGGGEEEASGAAARVLIHCSGVLGRGPVFSEPWRH